MMRLPRALDGLLQPSDWRLIQQAALAVIAGAFIIHYIGLGIVWLRLLHGNDFGKFYYAAQQWREGLSLYAASPATRMPAGEGFQEFLDMNPPHFHLVVLPLVGLSVETAGLLWMVVNAAAAWLAAVLIFRELGIRLNRWDVLPIAVGILACAATGAIVITGQFTGLLLLPMVGAWRAARHDRWATSGAWLGLLISVKPFLALFGMYLLIARRWRAFAMAGLVGAAAFLAGLLVFGWSAHREWIAALRSVEWPWAAMNASLFGLLSRTFGPSPYYAPILAAPAVITIGWWLAAGVVALITLWAARRSVDHGFAAVTLGALLISPLGWVYYIWLAVAPCLSMWWKHRPAILRLAALGLCVPLIWVTDLQPNPLATVTLGSAYTWGLLALWLGVVSDQYAPRSVATAPIVRLKM